MQQNDKTLIGFLSQIVNIFKAISYDVGCYKTELLKSNKIMLQNGTNIFPLQSVIQ